MPSKPSELLYYKLLIVIVTGSEVHFNTLNLRFTVPRLNGSEVTYPKFPPAKEGIPAGRPGYSTCWNSKNGLIVCRFSMDRPKCLSSDLVNVMGTVIISPIILPHFHIR